MTSPIGAHVAVRGGLATGGLAYADAVAARAVQVFVGNPRGWRRSAGAPRLLVEPTAGGGRALEAAVGPGRLGLVHANDFPDGCGSPRDRHARIGAGRIGLGAFAELLAHPSVPGVPVVVETPVAAETGPRDGRAGHRGAGVPGRPRRRPGVLSRRPVRVRGRPGRPDRWAPAPR